MQETRRARLNELLFGPRFNGDRHVFCQAAGITKGRLTQLLDPREPFGDVAAKNLTEKLGLQDGWFDVVAKAGAPDQVVPEKPTEVGLTPSATELALLFDLIPTTDTLHRSMAHAAASQAILDVLKLIRTSE